MNLTISEARAHLGHLCTRAQDPRQPIILTRHGKPIAALVSMAEVQRIWDLNDQDTRGIRNPLSGKFGNCLLPGFVSGLNGDPVTPREAAHQMREVQMTRAAEREILAAGGLEPVAGGEVGVPDQRSEPANWSQKAWQTIWRFRKE